MSVLCRVFNLSDTSLPPAPPTSTSPNVRSLLDVLHALSRLTFMVDIVTFEVGTVSVFLVGNIEI